MTSLPTGTITLLFTDIEGSTKLWEQYPAIMRDALIRHDALADSVLAEHSGHLVKPRGEGDSLFAVFARASDAVAAAFDLQRTLIFEPWPLHTSLRVRMALHTGETLLRDGDYYGPTVNRCARLRATAHGGQVIVSQVTRDLAQNALPDGVTLTDLGLHKLKDLTQAEHVWQLVHPELPADFPPLKSLRESNLPLQTTSFVGREKEIAESGECLANTRLLTLLGAGGTGKTRLSLHLAAEVGDTYPDGLWLVELAPLSDPALVPQAVAFALGVREEPGRALTETLLEHLRGKNLLLILDNCEHLLDACARFADRALRVCPDIRLLASSREALNIPGEATYRVPSLGLPSPEHQTPQTLLHSAAACLFVERATAARNDFAVTDANADAIAAICRQLDGIPLALELAASRVKALSPIQIAARLDDRFRLLTGGSRGALPRQQTLRALIDWSYDLLSEKEKTLLRRLSVFAGGWTLEAAEAVCADPE